MTEGNVHQSQVATVLPLVRGDATTVVRGRKGILESTDRAAWRGAVASIAVNALEAVALAAVSWVTGSVALVAQTAANSADVAVGVLLLVGVYSSARRPDETYPLGYGRERFFWSLFASLGIFAGGGGLALEVAVHSALNPSPTQSYSVGYIVVAAVLLMDGLALNVAARPLRQSAADRGIPLRTHLTRSTDSAAVTVVVSGSCSVIGGFVAAAGLAAGQLTGSPLPETIASAVIGVILLVASVLLLRTNRELIGGRGVSPAVRREMREIVREQAGVVDVPDLFAVVVGSSSLIVDGDVIFEDRLNVSEVEESIIRSTAALRARWPSMHYVYLTPVPASRPRRVMPATKPAIGTLGQLAGKTQT
jgi:cation diffusion facilitator family transporter